MAKFRFRLWHLIPLSIPIIYMMMDYNANAAEVASGYMSQETKGVESNKAAFIVQYRQAVEEKANAGKFDSVEGISISTELFTDTCIRLNTEAYQISEEELDNWRKTVTDEGGALYKGYVEYMNPLIPIATTIGEMGYAVDPDKGGMNMTNVAVMWTPVVYTKLVEAYSPDFDWSTVSVDNVDTQFYLGKGIYCVDDCGIRCTAENDGYRGHDNYWHANGNQSNFNDNDSLGPLQILRRYLGIENGQPGAREYGSGTVSDLLRWRDNSVYFYNTEGTAMKRDKNAVLYDKPINNVYQLVVLAAIAHNTGPTYLSTNSSTHTISCWKNVNAIYEFSDALTKDASIAKLRAIVDKWYADNVANGQRGENKFSFLGSESVEGRGGPEWAKKFYEDIGMNAEDYLKRDAANEQCQWDWATNNTVNTHKARYPLKTLLNYMCLEKLYQSGME